MNELTIDRRELTQHPNIPQLLRLLTTVATLDSADYAFLDRNNNPVGIERSEINNLMQKSRSGELESQLTRCAEQYKTVILLVEGVFDQNDGLLAIHKQSNNGYYRSRVYPHTTYSYAIGLIVGLSELGIEILWAPTFECSMGLIRTVFEQRTRPEEKRSLFRRIRAPHVPTKISTNPVVPRLMGLCPRLSEKTAVKLVYQYDTIWNILNADEKEVLKVEGMGKTLLKRLKDGIGL